MRNKTSTAPSWSFQSPFFESKAPMAEVLDSLSKLNEGAIENQRYEMTMQPLENGHSFRYTLARRQKRQWTPTAIGTGEVYEDPYGIVTVSGTVQVASGLYITLGLMFVIFIICDILLMRGLSFFFAFFFLVAGTMLFHHLADRNQAVDNISLAVGRAGYESEDKTKRVQASTRRTPSQNSVRPDSVWHDAISEYDTLKEE